MDDQFACDIVAVTEHVTAAAPHRGVITWSTVVWVAASNPAGTPETAAPTLSN